MEVKMKLFMRKRKVFSETKNKDVYYTDFFLSLNGDLIPIEVKYFKNPKLDGRDPGYQGRVAKLELIAEPLPDKPGGSGGTNNTSTTDSDVPPPSDADAPSSNK